MKSFFTALVKSVSTYVALATLVIIFSVFKSMQFNYSKFTLVTPSGITSEISFPFFLASNEVGVYSLKGSVDMGKYASTLVRIIPDDEILTLTINNIPVNLTMIPYEQRRDYNKGFIYDLKPYLREGVNDIQISYSDGGGMMGIQMSSLPNDSLIHWLYVLATLATLMVCYDIMRRTRLSKSLQILFLGALAIRIAYFMVTPPDVRGHDVGAHMAYVEHLAAHWVPPPVEQAAGGAFFHPPLYYYTAAAVYKIAQFFEPNNKYTLYRVLQLFGLAYSMGFILFGLLILDKLFGGWPPKSVTAKATTDDTSITEGDSKNNTESAQIDDKNSIASVSPETQPNPTFAATNENENAEINPQAERITPPLAQESAEDVASATATFTQPLVEPEQIAPTDAQSTTELISATESTSEAQVKSDVELKSETEINTSKETAENTTTSWRDYLSLRFWCTALKEKGMFWLVGSMFVFWPVNVIHSIRIGNDPILYFLLTASIYYTLRWYQEDKKRDLMIASVVAALSIVAKANGEIMIGVIGIVGLYKMIKTRQWVAYTKLAIVPCLVLFIAVIITILPGLILKMQGKRNYLYFQDLSGVSTANLVGNTAASVLWFDAKTFVTEPYTDPYDDRYGRQYFWNYLGKTGIIGEFRYNGVLCTNMAIICSFFAMWMMLYIIFGVYYMSKEHLKKQAPIILAGFLLWFSVTYMRVTFPVNIDFRYIQPALVSFCALYAASILTFHERGSTRLVGIGISMSVAFTLAGIAFILGISN